MVLSLRKRLQFHLRLLKITKLQKQFPYETVVDDDGNETGDLEFKFKQKAVVTSKKTGKSYEIKPKVFDAKGQPITKPLPLGNGSTIKVAFEPSPYFVAATKVVGVSLRGFDIQVIDLVEYGAGTGSVFGAEEGFELDEDDTEENSGFTAEEENYGEEDDF